MTFSYSAEHKANYKTLPVEEVLGWVSTVSGQPIADKTNVQGALKNGQILCKLINAIQPGSVRKIHTSRLGAFQMENISFFLRAIKKILVPEADQFSVVDLYDGSNIPQVLICLESVSRCAREVPGFSGPFIGVALSKKNVVDHSGHAKGGSNSRGLFETRVDEVSKKAQMVDRIRHNVVKNPGEEKKLYHKKYSEDDY